jgi:dihydrolipoamide dehydrogenase
MAKELEQHGTVIIGAGPGGYVAAIRAAELGQQVTVIEESDSLGGICLNVGCVPSKALISAGERLRHAKDSTLYGITTGDVGFDFHALQDWKQHQVVDRMTRGVEGLLKKHKVEVVRGSAMLVSNTEIQVMPAGPQQFMSVTEPRRIAFTDLIIASGSRPVEIPGFQIAGRVIDSTGGLGLEDLPDELVVIGGGYIGTELAGAYADFGTHVTILEGTGQILPNFEADLVKVVEKRLKAKGVTILTGVRAKHAAQTTDDVTVTYTTTDGSEKEVVADYCMITVGRTPNTDSLGLDATDVKLDKHGLIDVDDRGFTGVDHIWAVGDVTMGPALAHMAFMEGKTAAGAIAGRADANEYFAVPAVCFSDPEIATVGMTVAEAEQNGLTVHASQFPFAGNARAVSLGEGEGFVRLVSTIDTGTIVGAQIVGPGASDLISELSVAVNCQLNVEDVALTIHPHPTLGEPVAEAADIATGFPTHI